MINQQALVIGASSSIAQAIIQQLSKDSSIQITAITRTKPENDMFNQDKCRTIVVEKYQTENINEAIGQLNHTHGQPFTKIFICNGLLHNNDIHPEKKLEDFNDGAFQAIISANVITPMLWIQHLTQLLAHNKSKSNVNETANNSEGIRDCKITVFTARVGSITDNNLGGWYSYRSSKAALNMMLKTTAIELARRAKNIKLIAFHPGTTDTALSKPFQKNVPKNKLFTPEFVANQLLKIVEQTPIDGELSYLDWQGKRIPW